MTRQQRRAQERQDAKYCRNPHHTGPIYDIGEPVPAPVRTRTKGLPFSRHILVKMIPGISGHPGVVKLRHPTRGGSRTMITTPQLLRVFMPSAPDSFYNAMLGQEMA